MRRILAVLALIAFTGSATSSAGAQDRRGRDGRDDRDRGLVEMERAGVRGGFFITGGVGCRQRAFQVRRRRGLLGNN